MKPFTLQATFDRASTRKDGTLGLGFSTQELTSAEKVVVMDFVSNHGWLLFSSDEIANTDVPKMPTTDGKTPSQRLRGIIYLKWMQIGEPGDFESYYRRSIEKLITHVKGQLDD